MRFASDNRIRKLLITSLYILGVIGILASGGSGSGTDSEAEKCTLDSSKIGECKI